jgi:hypothetical protein
MKLEVMHYFMHYFFKNVIAALPLFTLLGGGYCNLNINWH